MFGTWSKELQNYLDFVLAEQRPFTVGQRPCTIG